MSVCSVEPLFVNTKQLRYILFLFNIYQKQAGWRISAQVRYTFDADSVDTSVMRCGNCWCWWWAATGRGFHQGNRPAADRGKYFARVDDSPNGANERHIHAPYRAHFSLLKRNCLKPIISKNHSAFCNVNHRKIGTMPPMIFVPFASHFHQAARPCGKSRFYSLFCRRERG